MDEPTKSRPTRDELFRVREQVEALTKQYVDTLLTSRNALADHVTLLLAIINSLGAGLLVTDKDGMIILANSSAVITAGRDPHQMHRDEFFKDYQFFKDDALTPLRPEEEPYHVVMKEKARAEMEGYVITPTKPDEGIWVRVQANPVLDESGDLIAVVTLFFDITERKRLQRQRDALATLITHDLKNHLAGEALFLEFLKSSTNANFAEEETSVIDELEQSTQQFLQISNTLIEIYRADLYHVQSYTAPIDIIDVIEQAMALNKTLAAVRHVDMKIVDSNGAAELTGIPSSLRQVFHNLLQNAIAISPKNGAVEVDVSSTPSSVKVDVRDHGPGMSNEQVKSLFAPERIAGTKGKSATSSGIGLFLCRLLVEAQGGTLSCHSKEGVGTTFSVELPIQKKPAPNNS